MLFMFTNDGSKRGWNNFGTIRYNLCFSKFVLPLKLLRADYDVLISNFPTWSTLFEFLISKLRRKRLIFWVEEWHQPRTLTRKTLTPILKFLVRNCDAIVACGSAATAHMMDYGATSEKIFVAPNASWVEVPPKHASRARISASSDKFTILYLGRLVRYKGVNYLIKAFSKLRKDRDDVKLLIVGDGDFKNSLEGLVRELGTLNIEFMGACDPKDKFYYYDICDVFVLPSVWCPSYCEAWGLVLNEAMQFGKPIISTDAVGSAFDLIKDGVNGFLVKNGDVESLYQALKRILGDPKLAQTMGAESKKIVEEGFTYERMIRGFKDAITFVETARKESNSERYW